MFIEEIWYAICLSCISPDVCSRLLLLWNSVSVLRHVIEIQVKLKPKFRRRQNQPNLIIKLRYPAGETQTDIEYDIFSFLFNM